MTTNITRDTGWARVGARLWKQRRYMIGLALIAMTAGTVLTVRTALALRPAICGSPDLQSLFFGTVFAKGTSTDKKFVVEQKGPTDVYQGMWTWRPGGDSGWHTHPGPVIFVVQSGELTEHQSNGCTRILKAGTPVIEPAGVLHDVVNDSDQTVQAYITLLTPQDVEFFTPADAPAPKPCKAKS
jgi:quercetin dioxygenase-like cupin family protein